MRASTRTLIQLYFRRLRVIVTVGIVFGAAVGAGVVSAPVSRLVGAAAGALSGAVDIGTMFALIGAIDMLLPLTRLGRALERAPFLATLALKTSVYCAVIVGVIGNRLGAQVVGLVVDGALMAQLEPQLQAKLPVSVLIVFAFLVVPLFLLMSQMRLIVGERTLRNIVRGRYHRPRTEERFFLFVDIAGSTPLAERVGPEAIHRFLDRVFRAASDPIDEHAGEVYQYVGDEMVITWTVPEGRAAAHPIACYFAIEAALAAESAGFEREFGVVPRLRAALHAGPVITGEVGGTRRAIVFHGDVMNTTSRIENATRDLERSFLVSADALARLDGAGAYGFEDLGAQPLRGRAAPVRLYAVRSGPAAP